MLEKSGRNGALIAGAVMVSGAVLLGMYMNRLGRQDRDAKHRAQVLTIKAEINDKTRELSAAVIEALQESVSKDENRIAPKNIMKFRQEKRDSLFRLIGRKDVLDAKKADAGSYDEGVVQPGLKILEVTWAESNKNVVLCRIEQADNPCYPNVGRRFVQLEKAKKALESLEKKK